MAAEQPGEESRVWLRVLNQRQLEEFCCPKAIRVSERNGKISQTLLHIKLQVEDKTTHMVESKTGRARVHWVNRLTAALQNISSVLLLRY